MLNGGHPGFRVLILKAGPWSELMSVPRDNSFAEEVRTIDINIDFQV